MPAIIAGTSLLFHKGVRLFGDLFFLSAQKVYLNDDAHFLSLIRMNTATPKQALIKASTTQKPILVQSPVLGEIGVCVGFGIQVGFGVGV